MPSGCTNKKANTHTHTYNLWNMSAGDFKAMKKNRHCKHIANTVEKSSGFECIKRKYKYIFALKWVGIFPGNVYLFVNFCFFFRWYLPCMRTRRHLVESLFLCFFHHFFFYSFPVYTIHLILHVSIHITFQYFCFRFDVCWRYLLLLQRRKYLTI